MSDRPPQLHRCDGCGTEAPWGSGWSWYGSLKDEDDGKPPVFKACSEACRLALAKKHKAPLALDAETDSKKPTKRRLPAWERNARAEGWTPPDGWPE